MLEAVFSAPDGVKLVESFQISYEEHNQTDFLNVLVFTTGKRYLVLCQGLWPGSSYYLRSEATNPITWSEEEQEGLHWPVADEIARDTPIALWTAAKDKEWY